MNNEDISASEAASAMARARWGRMTQAERSADMKARQAKRRERERREKREADES
jgi:hypothetical protein